MTPLEQSREYQRIAESLGQVAWRAWWVSLGERALAWAAASAALTAGLAWLAGTARLWPAARWTLLAVLLAAPLAGFILVVVWPLRRRLSLAQSARQVEQRIGGLQNRFINAVQLAGVGGEVFDDTLRRRALGEIALATRDVPVDRAVATRRLAWIAGAMAGVAALTVVLAMLAGPRLSLGLARLWHPAARGWVGQVRIDAVRPGDATVLLGESLTIEADVTAISTLRAEPAAAVWTRRAGESGWSAIPMRTRRPVSGPTGRGSYFLPLTNVDASFDYYAAVGDTADPDHPFRIEARRLPQVAGLAVTLAYPAYLSHEQPAGPSAEGHIDAPLGAVAAIGVRMNRPIASAEIALAGAATQPEAVRPVAMAAVDGDRTHWCGEVLLDASRRYRLVFRDRPDAMAGTLPAGASEADFFTITARPDAPPTAQFLSPAADESIKPGGSIDLKLQISDDHGLSGVKLMTARVVRGATPDARGELATEPATARQAWASADLRDTAGHARKLARITYRFDLPRDDSLAKGDRVVCWLEATDNRDLAAQAKLLGLPDGGGAQRAQSARLVLAVADPADLAADRARMLERLTAEIKALLAEQQAVRANAVALAHDGGKGFTPAAAMTVRDGQFAFAEHLLKLAKGLVVPFDAQTRPMQTSLLVLGYNDSADARALAQAVAVLPGGAASADPVKQLVARQDRVIYALQSLLGELGQAVQRTQDPSDRIDGTDLPPQEQARWRKLADELEKFIEQERRAIAVTESLAKKPADDFTDADKLQLKELAALQEQWEKFLNDAISDFSKLSEQDFSNPTLLKELIEVKDDVVMAKDALDRKAIEMAVPFEEASLEMAKELETNIEKWLPDKPDRAKWSMEEPTDQQDVPMAELPKELEDLVGELLEQEEDLFDDMQDVTSKWTDSLDVAAGWDALDGPMSNMSAKGVTGNQLPNENEINGRSGEGRTGKTSGEMVEQEATGKGGRQTPTRLSNDAFQAGQVKDSSKEPPGGATGGGKVAGVSGEGLEGPVPPELQQHLQRLSQKQASIRNQAEAVDARFRANNFNHFSLDKAIEVMRRTELDLSNYRYQNALRHKDVMVNNLQAQQSLLRGDILVQQDRSVGLPDVVRKDVQSVGEDEIPARYKDLAKQFLQSLSDSPASP